MSLPAQLLEHAGTPAPMATRRFPTDIRVDALETVWAQEEHVECPVVHQFTPGLYSREFHAAAGTQIISKIHKTEHQYVISQGRALVWMDDERGWVELSAPYRGVTQPGTRRVLIVLEDLIWTTFHPTTLKTVEEIEAAIIQPHDPQEALRDFLVSITNHKGAPWLGQR
jgi:hypothetical protein